MGTSFVLVSLWVVIALSEKRFLYISSNNYYNKNNFKSKNNYNNNTIRVLNIISFENNFKTVKLIQ